MLTVAIKQLTQYRYKRNVQFGEHRILVRPRESYDQRVLSATLSIDPPQKSLRLPQEAFGSAALEARASGEMIEMAGNETRRETQASDC